MKKKRLQKLKEEKVENNLPNKIKRIKKGKKKFWSGVTSLLCRLCDIIGVWVSFSSVCGDYECV